jgi:23S rRNA pseudouridine2605 synthase
MELFRDLRCANETFTPDCAANRYCSLMMERKSPLPATAPTQKLQKVLAQAGLGSRREIEGWIAQGRVSVNGVVAKIGSRVAASDAIRVGGQLVRLKVTTPLPRVLLYHKPEGEITSRDDPQKRPSVFARLPPARGAKWIAVGRLDFNTCGLLVFTTSGELANRLMHPRFAIDREYAVRVRGELSADQLRKLEEGIVLSDGPVRCEKVELRGGQGTNQWCHVLLREGRNRVVRRMFEALGVMVSRLLRVRYGMIALPPRLRRGQYHELSRDETQKLVAWLNAGDAPVAPRERDRGPRAERRSRRPRKSPAR